MRKSVWWLPALLIAASFSLPTVAQPKAGGDISGIWLLLGGGGFGAQAKDAKSPITGGSAFKGFPESQWSSMKLPFTPDGLAAFLANKPGGGPRGVKRQQDDNDPIHGGNPWGLYRTLTEGRPIEFLQTPGKVVQLFDEGRVFRIIYTDGRPVPDDIPDGPFWYGYSVGHWEGDTLVVDTLALDGRQWMDLWGTPITDDARVQERWRRDGKDQLLLTITVTDPQYYTKPWTSDVMHYFLRPQYEPKERIMAPMDEDYFNKTLRDPADLGPGHH